MVAQYISRANGFNCSYTSGNIGGSGVFVAHKAHSYCTDVPHLAASVQAYVNAVEKNHYLTNSGIIGAAYAAHATCRAHLMYLHSGYSWVQQQRYLY